MKKTILLLLVTLGMILTVHAQIPANGLVASYPFNGNANDQSVAMNHGIVDGAILTTDRFGDINSAYWFDGIDDRIRIPGALPVTNEFTISFWAYSESTSGYSNVLCDGSSSAGGADFLLVFRGNEIGIRADKNAPLNHEYSSPAELTNLGLVNNWVHVVWVMNPAASTIYLNGVELVTINEAGSNEGYHDDFSFLGARQVWGSPDNFFTGKLDDIFIYNRALDPAEIESLYNGGDIGEVTDIDGNVYSTIRIGHQVWMQENLRTTRYQNAETIGTTADPYIDITAEVSPQYQWAYGGDEANVGNYGRLYTWYAVTDNRNICPDGWHVPSNEEWTVLTDYLTDNGYGYGGIGNDIAKSMASSSGWAPDPTPGNVGNDQESNNSSGFTGPPGGARHRTGLFNLLGSRGMWWSSTEHSPDIGHNRILRFDGWFLEQSYFINMSDGYSVRCLQDREYSMYVENTTIEEGQALQLPVSLSYVSTIDNFISYQFDIEYDETVLAYTGSDLTGTLAEGGTVEVNSSVAGQLSVSYMNSSPLEGEGAILLLEFNPMGADTTEVLISNAYLNSNAVDNLENGLVIIRDVSPPSAAITYNEAEIRCGDDLIITATFNEAMLESAPVFLHLDGAIQLSNALMLRQTETMYSYHYPVPCADGLVNLTLSNGTDLWGNEVMPFPSSGGSFNLTGITPGDVDDDGIVLAYDAALTLQHSVGMDPLPIEDPLPWENWRDSTANVDGIAGITANDAGMILQYSAGLITNFLGGSKKSAPQGFITMQFVKDGIILHSSGRLLGLNISMTNDFDILGTPEVLTEGMLTAFNIDEDNYKIGLCTSTPPENGEAIMKIPVHGNGYVEAHMVINTEERMLPLNLTTGLDHLSIADILVYPNPVNNTLNISGLTTRVEARIYNPGGQLMQVNSLEYFEEKIDVSNLPAGLYILRLDTEHASGWKRFIKE